MVFHEFFRKVSDIRFYGNPSLEGSLTPAYGRTDMNERNRLLLATMRTRVESKHRRHCALARLPCFVRRKGRTTKLVQVPLRTADIQEGPFIKCRIYRVCQEFRSIFRNLIKDFTLKQKRYIYMRPIRNCSGALSI
jgi:hypothetical protein